MDSGFNNHYDCDPTVEQAERSEAPARGDLEGIRSCTEQEDQREALGQKGCCSIAQAA